MIASIQFGSRLIKFDLSKPLDISIPIQDGEENVNAWYVGPPKLQPYSDGEFTGSVQDGSVVNFYKFEFLPHSHGTHTECVGHITEKVHSINANLKQYFHLAELITVAPEKLGEDFVISAKQIRYALRNKKREALIIRTIPNMLQKRTQQYSNTNPPYLLEDAAKYLASKGIKHLLIDLPSVDREQDEGALLAHRAFWNMQGAIRYDATITEFIYVDNSIEDGSYLLDLQVAPFENDASPSRPVLYQPIL